LILPFISSQAKVVDGIECLVSPEKQSTLPTKKQIEDNGHNLVKQHQVKLSATSIGM